MKRINPHILLRIAQADAYCSAVEYVKLPDHQALVDEALTFQRYLKHPTHKLSPGQYTDDTQMSIANAMALIGDKFVSQSPKNSPQYFADFFVNAFARDKRDGYARGFQAILEQVVSGADLLQKVDANSDKNGAAMRSVPFGVVENLDEGLRLATIQAKITHNTAAGILSSQAVTAMTHYAIYEDGPLSDMDTFMIDALGEEFRPYTQSYEGGRVAPPDVGLKTMHCVYDLVKNSTSLMGILKDTILIGGDTDSVAAIAWGVASSRYMDEVLPAFLSTGLESGRYGRDYLVRLGDILVHSKTLG